MFEFEVDPKLARQQHIAAAARKVVLDPKQPLFCAECGFHVEVHAGGERRTTVQGTRRGLATCDQDAEMVASGAVPAIPDELDELQGLEWSEWAGVAGMARQWLSEDLGTLQSVESHIEQAYDELANLRAEVSLLDSEQQQRAEQIGNQLSQVHTLLEELSRDAIGGTTLDH